MLFRSFLNRLSLNPYFTYGVALVSSGALLVEGIKLVVSGDSPGDTFIIVSGALSTTRTAVEAGYYFLVDRQNRERQERPVIK